jgi:hypothetical protein
MAVTAQDVQALYIAYFNRPADFLGLSFQLDQANKFGLKQVADQFAKSPEYLTTYANKGTAEVIDTIYMNLFGRHAEPDGIKFWGNLLLNGDVTMGNVALNIFNGAINDDKTTVQNKLSAAQSFYNSLDTSAEIVGYSGDAANGVLKTWLAGITTTASLTAATTDAALQAVSTAATAAHDGFISGTFTLTTSQDTLPGTAGNDVLNAGVIQNGAGALTDTLQNVDAINGGAGIDTLNVTLFSSGAAVTPSLTNIENVNLRATGGASILDLSASTGVTAITIANSTSTGGVLAVGTANLAVANQNAEADFSGSTATALNLGLDTVGKAALTGTHITVDLAKSVAAKATSLNITANNANANLVETTASAVVASVSVAATGTNELNLSAADAGTVKTLAVTGAGSVDFTGVALSALTTVTAADGGVKVNSTNATAAALTVTTGAGADTITANGASIKSLNVGAGDDKVTLNTGALSATSTVSLGNGNDTVTLTAAPTAAATIDGGAGTDTFAVTGAIYSTITGVGFTDAQRALISNFEVLKVTDALTNAAAYDVSKLAGVGSFVAGSGVTNGQIASVTSLGANASVSIEGAQTTGSAAIQEVQTLTFTGTTRTDGNITVGGVTVAVLAADSAAVTAGKVQTALNTATLTAPASTGAVTATVVGDVVTVTFPTTGGDVGPIILANGTSTITGVVTDTEVTKGALAVSAVGGGTLNLALKTDTSADVLNLKLNVGFTENNDATATVPGVTHLVNASLVETLNVESTGTASTKFLAAAGNKADGLNNTLTLTDDALVTLNVKGDQAFTFTSAITQTKLATIDASANTAGATIDAHFANVTTPTSSAAMTIKGSATASNTLIGTGNADTIVGGTKADVITGGAGGDTLTGNGGNDKFVFAAGDSTIAAGKADTITDFVANTFGAGANGIVTSVGATGVAATSLTGDVIQLSNLAVGSAKIVTVGVYTNAADATTFLQTQSTTEGPAASQSVHAALNSTTGDLYIDNDGNGTVDLYIHLTGVTTLNAAAFVIV